MKALLIRLDHLHDPFASARIFLNEPHLGGIKIHLLAGKIAEVALVLTEIENQTIGIERLILISARLIVLVHAVLSVAKQGVTDMRHMSADLVSSSRNELDLKKRAVASRRQHLIFCYYILVALLGLIGNRYKIVRAVLFQISRKGVCHLLRIAVDGAEIELSDLVVFYLLVHNAQSLGILCRDNDTSRVSVDTVAKRGSKGLLGIGVILALLIEICLDMHYEGILPCAIVLVDKHPGTLVAKNYIVILVNYIQLWRDSGKCAVVPFGRAEELVTDEELYLVAPLVKSAFARISCG